MYPFACIIVSAWHVLMNVISLWHCQSVRKLRFSDLQLLCIVGPGVSPSSSSVITPLGELLNPVALHSSTKPQNLDFQIKC